MLDDFIAQYPSVNDTLDEASDALNQDIHAICQDAEKLAQTAYTQPALLTASTALWRLWQSKSGQQPDILAGHSLGEYSALVAAEVLSFADAVRLVHARGQFMQAAVTEGNGAMAAILGKSADEVISLCDDISTYTAQVSAANFNCNGQIVVAGHTAAVDKLITLAKAEKFRAIKLAVSVPSHCTLMSPAASQLQQKIDEITFHPPSIPVIQNLDAQTHTQVDDIKAALIGQLSQPVQWTATMKQLADRGISNSIECGPGTVLSSLAKRQKLALNMSSIGTTDTFETVLAQMS